MNNLVINKNKTVFILFFIIFIGSLLRFFNLGSESFWRDEIMAVNESSNDSLKHIISNRLENGHSPLYFIFMHYWISAFGKRELWVRFPSAIFGIASILLIYFLAKELFDTKIGLLSSFFQAIGAIDIIYSQEARMYSALSFFAILSTFFLIKILKYNKYQAKFYWLGYFISLSLCLFLSPAGTLILISQSIYIFFIKKKHKEISRKLILYILLISFLYAPLFWIMARNNKLAGEHVYPHNFRGILELFKTFTPLVFGKIMYLNGAGGYNILFSLYFIFVLFAIYYYLRNIKTEIASILLYFLFIPPLVLFIITKFLLPVFLPRYVLFVSSSFYIISAYFLLSINNKILKFTTFFVLIILCFFSLYFYYTNGIKPNWQEILEFIRGHHREKVEIISLYSGGYSLELDHYNRGVNNIIYIPPLEKLDWIDFNVAKESIFVSFKVKKLFESEIRFLNFVYNSGRIKNTSKVPLEFNINFTSPTNVLSLIFPHNESNEPLIKLLSKNYKFYIEKIFSKGWMLPDDIKVIVFLNYMKDK